MSSISFVSFVSPIYITRKSLEYQRPNAYPQILRKTELALRARTQVHLDKCTQGAKHNLSASTGRVEITAATPCNARADFSIFPDCDGEIVCDTNDDALTTESRTEFNAENASSESLLGVISDSGASSSQKTTGKISEAGRDMAALMSAGGDVDSNEMCLLQVTASRGIEFKTKSWREMMEERMRMFN